MNRIVLMSALVLAAVCCIGCDNTGGKKAISGSVTLKGVALDSGRISFSLPEGQTPEAEALIKAGKYDIPAVNGLQPGTYRVKLTAPEEFNITPEEYAAGKTAPPARERIPAKYNTMSEEMVEVKAGKNVFDFKID